MSTVLAGRGEADVQTTRAHDAGADAALLREVLHAGPGAAGGRVHEISLLPTGKPVFEQRCKIRRVKLS